MVCRIEVRPIGALCVTPRGDREEGVKFVKQVFLNRLIMVKVNKFLIVLSHCPSKKVFLNFLIVSNL